MKTKMMKQQKGITLIALVITIIVLLILAGVAVSMLSGENGILKQAANAKTQTEKKSEEEAVKLAAIAAMTNANHQVDESVLKKELDTQLGAGKYTITETEDGWKIVVTKTGNHYSVSGKGEAKHLAWYYTEDGKQVTNGKEKITLGDKVIYNPTEGLKENKQYKSEETKNGYEDQTFILSIDETAKTKQALEWRVVGIDEDGNILIMPTTNIKNETGSTYWFYLGTDWDDTDDLLEGQRAAQYGAEEVNKIASIYGYGKGAKSARSITEEDIAKIVNPTLSSGTNVYDYGNKVTYEWVSDTSTKYSWTNKNGELKTGTYSSGFTYLDGNTWKTLSATNQKATLTSTYKSYSIEESKCKNTNLYNLLTLNTDNDQYYWLGSSFVLTGPGNAYFGVRYVGNFNVDYCGFFSSDGYAYHDNYGVRPAVSLESDITFGGNATDGWTIQ